MDEGHADPEAAQEGDIEQQVAEILVFDNAAPSIAMTKTLSRNWGTYPKDFAQISQAQHAALPKPGRLNAGDLQYRFRPAFDEGLR